MKNRELAKRAIKTLIALDIHLGAAPVTNIALKDVVFFVLEMAEASDIEGPALIDECVAELLPLKARSAKRSVLEDFQSTTRAN